MRSGLAESSAKLSTTGFSSAAVRADGAGAGDARTQTAAGVASTLATEMGAGRGAATGVHAGARDACRASCDLSMRSVASRSSLQLSVVCFAVSATDARPVRAVLS